MANSDYFHNVSNYDRGAGLVGDQDVMVVKDKLHPPFPRGAAPLMHRIVKKMMMTLGEPHVGTIHVHLQYMHVYMYRCTCIHACIHVHVYCV